MNKKFCANCDAEAVSAVLRDDRETYPLPLCFTCATAYEWGQVSPDRPIVDIGDVDPEDWRKGGNYYLEHGFTEEEWEER